MYNYMGDREVSTDQRHRCDALAMIALRAVPMGGIEARTRASILHLSDAKQTHGRLKSAILERVHQVWPVYRLWRY